MESSAYGIDITFCGGLSAELFRRQVGLFTDHRAGGGRLNFMGHIEVDEFECAIGMANENVFEVDITMNYL